RAVFTRTFMARALPLIELLLVVPLPPVFFGPLATTGSPPCALSRAAIYGDGGDGGGARRPLPSTTSICLHAIPCPRREGGPQARHPRSPRRSRSPPERDPPALAPRRDAPRGGHSPFPAASA